MQIRILGAHNFETRDSRFVSILIDGVLAIDAGSLTASLTMTEQERITSVLLTHRHFDHVRDVPTLGLNTLHSGTTSIYGQADTLQALSVHLLNDVLYGDLTQRPSPEAPSLRYVPIPIGRPCLVDGYQVLALPVNHSVPTVGYQVRATDGKALFYGADTGSGLSQVWERVQPDLLILECTMSNRQEAEAQEVQHLCPSLLKEELTSFQKLKGYLPQVVTIHLNPTIEDEIRRELGQVSQMLNFPITPAQAGMVIQL